MKKRWIIFTIILVLFSSCRKEDPVIEVTPAMARDSLYYIMKQWYYWYDRMPSVTKENYPDPYTLLDALRYKERDRWSFVADYEEFLAEMQGTFVGHGIRVGLDGSSNARIAMIYKQSPLYASGVRRGWILKTVNGYDIADILSRNDDEAYNEAFGAPVEGVTNQFLFSPPGMPDISISSTKTKFTLNTVILYDTIHLSSGSVAGHLVLDAFIEPTENELKTAFAFFKTAKVKELILDLRYNTGGYLDLAQLLASYIAGNGLTGSVLVKLQYNDKNPDENKVYPFQPTLYPLSVTDLVVITTRSTASASEAVINGLAPAMSIVLVGDTTNGKPTGMNGWPCAKKWYFWPVTFTMVNSLDQGAYYDGFAPDKPATDDITHDFDDREEECLNEAIRYLETGEFSSKGDICYRRPVHFSERPEWIKNTFIRKK